MNRERAKELLPVIEGYANGKTVQYRDDEHCPWIDLVDPGFEGLYGQYRIKLEPHDIKWAAEQMMKGKAVRRSSWGNTHFYIKLSTAGYISEIDRFIPWTIHVDDLFADDWEIYEPKGGAS